MDTKFLSGNEAIAHAAYSMNAFGAGYPGTPATEVLETLMQLNGPDSKRARWSVNEKIAYERAIGLSFAGQRVVVAFKQVGLNVAADPFFSSAVIGTPGLVVASADDPGQHSSPNEYDSRIFADAAGIPFFEPASSQEAYDMARDAFKISEQYGIPTMVRLVTNVAHTKSKVQYLLDQYTESREVKKDLRKWCVLPNFSRPRIRKLFTEEHQKFESLSEQSKYNELVLDDESLGVIACGNAANYLKEVAEDGMSYLKIGQYPLPTEKVSQLLDHVNKVIVLEEGSPFVERLTHIVGNKFNVEGKLTNPTIRTGELTPSLVRNVLGKSSLDAREANQNLPPRRPMFCGGCSHSQSFYALGDALEGLESYITGDIGCYTLGMLPPHSLGDTCADMGGSVGIAMGMVEGGLNNVIATIGDSTFTAADLPAILEAANENTKMTIALLDNRTVAMTGMQEALTLDDNIERILHGLGVKGSHMLSLDAKSRDRASNAKLLRNEIEYEGLSVVILRGPCVQQVRKEKKDV